MFFKNVKNDFVRKLFIIKTLMFWLLFLKSVSIHKFAFKFGLPDSKSRITLILLVYIFNICIYFFILSCKLKNY